MEKRDLRNKLLNFLGQFGDKIKTKFTNISGKTGQYDVPDELYQKRTSRKNRVLISWKTVKENKLTFSQLKSFEGGVVVEFCNNDFFDLNNKQNALFNRLVELLGSDEIVSSIITIRAENGSSSSQIQREAFENLIDNLEVTYQNHKVIVNKNNFKDFAIKQIKPGGTGNEKWTGFLFVSIHGGQQDVINSNDKSQTIFNPACEFATEDVSLDLDLTMAYFAMNSIDYNNLSESQKNDFTHLINLLKSKLKNITYDNPTYKGDLLTYCNNHPSLKMVNGKLYDPIQVEQIDINDFGVDNKEDPRNIDFTHDEAVNKEKYYWDNIKMCLLSAARPTNVFWSKHLSNMMQQNFTLQEYFDKENEIVKKRNELLNKV